MSYQDTATNWTMYKVVRNSDLDIYNWTQVCNSGWEDRILGDKR